jgi:hypothetical protein
MRHITCSTASYWQKLGRPRFGFRAFSFPPSPAPSRTITNVARSGISPKFVHWMLSWPFATDFKIWWTAYVTRTEPQSLSHTANEREKGGEVISHAIRALVSKSECVHGLICDAHLYPRKEREVTDEEGGSVVQTSGSVHSVSTVVSQVLESARIVCLWVECQVRGWGVRLTALDERSHDIPVVV